MSCRFTLELCRLSALEQIRRLAIQGRVFYSRHAQARMLERNVEKVDVISALITATAATWQAANTYRVEGGTDTHADPLVVVVAIDVDAIVITVF